TSQSCAALPPNTANRLPSGLNHACSPSPPLIGEETGRPVDRSYTRAKNRLFSSSFDQSTTRDPSGPKCRKGRPPVRSYLGAVESCFELSELLVLGHRTPLAQSPIPIATAPAIRTKAAAGTRSHFSDCALNGRAAV